jgi:hypothetical protein
MHSDLSMIKNQFSLVNWSVVTLVKQADIHAPKSPIQRKLGSQLPDCHFRIMEAREMCLGITRFV